MSFLNDLDCPQFVDFKSEFIVTKDSITDAETSSYPAKYDMDSNSMSVEDESVNSSYYQDDSVLGSMHSMVNSPYLAYNSYQDSIEGTESVEEYQVNHVQNLSLPEADQKKSKYSKNKKTIVKPFHLTESKKRKREDEHIPLAEQVAAFHKKTPERFHTTGPKVFEPTKHWSPQIVCPQSPNLQAAKRRRGVKVLSREELEAKELEEIKRYRFRARPVKQNILNSPRLPKVGKKLPTRPKDFNLRTAQRAAEIKARKKEEDTPFEFHARPVPKAILDGPTGLKEKPSIHPTEPRTPKFALKSRAAKWKSEKKLNESASETLKFKAAPAPAPTSSFTIKHEKKRTEIQPFSFDVKDKERMSKKEQKIAEEIEKENRVYVFKAQQVPSLSPCPLPPVPKKPATRPQPFNLHSESKTSKQNSFNLSLDHSFRTFKAQPATVLEKPPFIPEKPLKEPIEIKEFNLHTDIRASERLKLKEINDIKEREKELALQRFRELQEEEERKEIEKQRKEAVHKANPIRHYKPVEIKPSSKPPTTPISPKFQTDQRLQSRH